MSHALCLDACRSYTYMCTCRIRKTWPALDILFLNVHKQFNIDIPKIKAEKCSSKNEAHDINYKLMITFFIKGIFDVPFLKRFRYLMRLDDDSCIRHPINYNIFREMVDLKAKYAYRFLLEDTDECSFEFEEFISDYMDTNQLKYKNYQLAKLTKALGIHTSLNGKNQSSSTSSSSSTRVQRHFAISNNFEILDVKRLREPDIQLFSAALVASNMIFARRWGDANIR